jgi:ABC-type phosphate/phosphonate transport system ATPase subunit
MVSHSDIFGPAFSGKTTTLKKIEGAQLSTSGSPTALIAGAMLALLPHAANATGNAKVTSCRIWLQGALAE